MRATTGELRFLYRWRVVNYAAVALEGTLLALEVLWRNVPGAIAAAVGAGIMLAAVGRNARRITTAQDKSSSEEEQR